jgi:uncharacterized protein (TIGR02099 family)
VIRKLLQRLLKIATYAAATVVILLAIAVGLFRMFLPRLPAYQEDIKVWASAAIGMEVQFSGMDARWGLSGPEVEFYQAELLSMETGATIIAAGQVSVGIAMSRIINDRKAVVDRIIVRDSTLVIRQLEDGQWWVQGSPPNELLPARPRSESDGEIGRIEVFGEDLTVQLLQPGVEQTREFEIPKLLISRDSVRTAVDATINLPGDIGDSLTIVATQLVAVGDEEPGWEVDVDIEDVELAGISTLHTSEVAQFESGQGDLQLSFAIEDSRLTGAAAEIDFDDVSVGDSPAFSFDGRLELLNDLDGWLVAADGFRLETGNGVWPSTDLRVEAGTDADGKIERLDIRASFLKIDDIRVIRPWLKPEQKQQLDDYAPDGVIRNLEVTVSELDTDAPSFAGAIEFDRVGVAAVGKTPGVRGFSGVLRSDTTGGLFEIRATQLSVHVPTQLLEPIALDELSGTLIWRRSNNRTTVLSDSIVFGNQDFAFESNIEMTLEDGSRKPTVDLASTWSVSDIAIAKKYIPFFPRVARTSEWIEEGLLGGQIPHGTVRLYGPLEKWPFDGGEGHFHVDAEVRDALIMYQRGWPAAEFIELDIAVDNMRLHTNKNLIVNDGVEISDARVEIDDFRNPILSVVVETTGSLDAVRKLLVQSPVGRDTLKGKLEEISIEGDGSVDLDLKVPLKLAQDFELTSNVRTESAAIQMVGFPAVLTEISGLVTLGRDDISSEALVGTFLGGPVSIELHPAPASMPGYRIIASASGTATAEAILDEFDVPLRGDISGATDFEARLLFARGDEGDQQAFQVDLTSELDGLSIDLPAPLNKTAEMKIPLSAVMRLPAEAESIVTTGLAQDLLSWRLDFNKTDDRWDLDRGVVAFGDAAAGEAETRGLHFRGRATTVTLQDWLDRKRQTDSEAGLGVRIRSADMTVDNLFIFGQHLRDHRVRLDRSGQEWLVKFDGADIVGSVSVPYDFNAGLPLVLDMERLVLPGSESEESADSDSESQLDPRTLPAIRIDAEEFAIGTRFLGTVHVNLEKTADGLEATDLLAKDTTSEVSGSVRWVVDESDPSGSRSYLSAKMTSTDVVKTMQRLDYEPGIVSDDFSIDFNIDWSGGPRDDFRDSLNGDVSVRVGTGQLSEVEPGAGRMIGIMSVVSLPRRLSLDFRDVFNKGFGFDQIRGRFKLHNGQSFTCNLSLEGPAAQIGVVGRAGLVDRDYDQTAVVSASFGNALPVLGAALGGPVAAGVVLIFSQIFKKPLAEAGQVFYGISGSWDEPVIETVSAQDFAEQGIRAGCLDEAE